MVSKTQDMGTQDWHLLNPLPSRKARPGALESPQESPGWSGTRSWQIVLTKGPWQSSGPGWHRELGRSWRNRQSRGPWPKRELGATWRHRQSREPWRTSLCGLGLDPQVGLFGQTFVALPKKTIPWGKLRPRSRTDNLRVASYNVILTVCPRRTGMEKQAAISMLRGVANGKPGAPLTYYCSLVVTLRRSKGTRRRGVVQNTIYFNDTIHRALNDGTQGRHLTRNMEDI